MELGAIAVCLICSGFSALWFLSAVWLSHEKGKGKKTPKFPQWCLIASYNLIPAELACQQYQWQQCLEPKREIDLTTLYKQFVCKLQSCFSKIYQKAQVLKLLKVIKPCTYFSNITHMIFQPTLKHIWEKKSMPQKLRQYTFFFFKRRKDYTKISYTTMTSMKDKNASKAKFIFMENLSHTILEVQEKE